MHGNLYCLIATLADELAQIEFMRIDHSNHGRLTWTCGNRHIDLAINANHVSICGSEDFANVQELRIDLALNSEGASDVQAKARTLRRETDNPPIDFGDPSCWLPFCDNLITVILLWITKEEQRLYDLHAKKEG